MHAATTVALGIEGLPYVNWVFWGALSGGTLFAVGLTDGLGGTTDGYRRFMALTVLACGLIWLVSEMSLVQGTVSVELAEARRTIVWAFIGLELAYLAALWTHRSWRAWPAIGGGVVGLLALVTLGLGGGTDLALFAGWLLAAALALGSVTAAMLLGHWYLVTPKLSPAPLRRLIGLVIGALLAEGLLAAAILVTGGLPVEDAAWLVLLWLGVGIAFPVVVAVLALLATRAASLQATTGLLYVGLLFVIAGTIGGASMTYLGLIG